MEEHSDDEDVFSQTSQENDVTISEIDESFRITDDELSRYIDEYKELVTNKLGFARNGYGVQVYLDDVGLGSTHKDALAHVRYITRR